jgi:hypothetical protein
VGCTLAGCAYALYITYFGLLLLTVAWAGECWHGFTGHAEQSATGWADVVGVVVLFVASLHALLSQHADEEND